METQLDAEYFKTADQYLAAERVAETKHEYLAGAIYARAGATAAHNRIAANLLAELGAQLRGRHCEAFSSDMKVRVRRGTADFHYYPDVTVDCSRLPGDAVVSEAPRVIFEIMSPQTERIDRGEKLHNYQAVPSLGVYVLLDQRRIAATVHRRGTV